MGSSTDLMTKIVFRNEIYGDLARFTMRLVGFFLVFLTAKIPVHPLPGKYLIRRKKGSSAEEA